MLLHVVAQFMKSEPILSEKLMPSDDVLQQLLSLLSKLLQSDGLPQLAIYGAWDRMGHCAVRPRLGQMALDLGLVDLAAEHLRAMGSPADAVSISRGSAGRAMAVLSFPSHLSKTFAGQQSRPDLEAFVSSGLFDICLQLVEAFASAAVDVQDTNHSVLYFALSLLTKCSDQPGCEAKVRGVAAALAYCLEHSLDFMAELGKTTGADAAKLCCSVFGRDEGGSEFTFTPLHIEILTESWSQIVNAVGWYANDPLWHTRCFLVTHRSFILRVGLPSTTLLVTLSLLRSSASAI
eukprot:COSAG02_NODE_2555_length_8532_cov_7.259900_5_plen_292_part_00